MFLGDQRCTEMPMGTLPVNCTTHGHLCPFSCGLCGQGPDPTCSPQEIKDNKARVKTLWQDLGLCPECVVPDGLTWRDEKWGLKKADANFQLQKYGYSSGVPKDPCSYVGARCDRCGELRGFSVGHPSPISLGGKGVSDVIFSFTKLQSLLMWTTPGNIVRSRLPPGRSFGELPDLGYL